MVRIALLASMLALTALAAPASAVYDNVEFTTLLSDEDTPPIAESYWDILDLAVGEPGDGSLVFRSAMGSLGDAPSPGSITIFWGFNSAGVQILGGGMQDGTPDTRNLGEPIPPRSCVAEGDELYCQWVYSDIAAKAGDTLTEIWAFVDGCAPPAGCLPTDVVPGEAGHADATPVVGAWPAWSAGTTYTLEGSTVVDGGTPPPASGPTVRWLNLTRDVAEIDLTFSDPTSDIYNYNWTTDADRLTLTIDATNVGGTVVASLRDADGNAAYSVTIDEDTSVDEEIVGLPGTWTITLAFEGFEGDLSLRLSPVGTETETGTGQTPTTTSTRTGTSTNTNGGPGTGTNTTDPADEDSPATGIVLAVLLITGIVAALRRRI